MKRLALAVSAALIGMLIGCETENSAIVSNRLPPNVVTPTNPSQPTMTRYQKPDTEVKKPDLAKSLLDTPPDRVGDVCGSIRATVNGKAILNEEVRVACFAALQATLRDGLSAQERAARQKEILTSTLEIMVERELLVQDAMTKLKNPQGQKFLEKVREAADKEFDRWLRNIKTQLNLKSDDEVKDWLRAQGLNISTMKKQKETQYIAEEYLRQMVIGIVDRVGHEQIVEYFEQHPEEFLVTDLVKWQDLMIDASQYSSRTEAGQVADQLVRRLRANEDFLKLAEIYDPRGFRFTHGDGLGQKRGQIQPPELEHALFTMRDGDAAMIEIPTGFHVIRLVKRTHAGRQPLDDKLQSQIKDKLRNEVGIREQKRFLNQLKSRATIEYSSITP
jgi:parvulin-like peptidyl-prolyl isomerase